MIIIMKVKYLKSCTLPHLASLELLGHSADPDSELLCRAEMIEIKNLSDP